MNNGVIKVTDKDGKQVFTSTPTRVSSNLGNYYIKSGNFPNEFKIAFEDEDKTLEMPKGKGVYGYIDGEKFPLSKQDNWEKEHLATIENTNHYYEGNSYLKAPTAYKGVMGSFTMKKLGFVNVNFNINHRGALIDMRVNNNSMLYAGGGYGRNITSTGNYLLMLNPGTYHITLYMDGDNEDGSRVNYQKYEIDAIYPSFKF